MKSNVLISHRANVLFFGLLLAVIVASVIVINHCTVINLM